MRRLAAVRRLWLSALLALPLLALPAAPALAKRTVPRGFLGVMADGPMLASAPHLTTETGRMASAGVESVRAAFYWDEIQPTQTGALDFSVPDRVVLAAARRRLQVLPVVIRAPDWAAADPTAEFPEPRQPADYAALLTKLVARYGPAGTFWAAHPTVRKLAIRDWQVWNEPNLRRYWRQPFAASFTKLLAAAHTALKAADRHSRLVLGGLTNFSWKDLGSLYAAGARKLIDVVAIHPYSNHPKNVVKIVKLVRGVMNKHGDRKKPLELTEVSWAAAKGRATTDYGWNVTAHQQASHLTELFRLLAHDRRTLGLRRVYWYTWSSTYTGKTDPFRYSGLRVATSSSSRSTRAFTAFKAFARHVEGCRKTKTGACA